MEMLACLQGAIVTGSLDFFQKTKLGYSHSHSHNKLL